jgi:aspartyl/asparaginyl-tRNA synthetase
MYLLINFNVRERMENTREFHVVTNKLRAFFLSKGFIEVPAQSRLSILAACEAPKTIAEYKLTGITWPLPQTGQMWLEREMIANPDWPGVFCSTTSYRDEPNPIPGRHFRIFPMFEFESKGDMEDLKKLETEILKYLGFQTPTTVDYETYSKEKGISTIEAEHEKTMCDNINQAIILEHFPTRSHPFWNMKYRGDDVFKKVDVILHGMETIGSAERSCNPDEMRNFFETVSDGEYAQLLFNKFGKERVMKELNDYLSLDFYPRFGGGIGVHRMARAMRLAGLLNPADISFYGAFKTNVDQLTM